MKIQKIVVTADKTPYLLPKTWPSSGPGITANPNNHSPFFIEYLDTVAGQTSLQWSELTGNGIYYTLEVSVPFREATPLKLAMQSIQAPAVATATQDVHLIQTAQSRHMLSYTTAQVGSQDRWILIGGNPATAQEEFALFRSTDGGTRWTLPAYTTFRGNHQFLGMDGLPSIKFWNAHDGIIAESSGFAQAIPIEYTADGGKTWQQATVPKSGSPTGAQAPTIVRHADGSIDVSTTVFPSHKSVTIRSTDDGKTWSLVNG